MYFDEQKYLIWSKFLKGKLKTESRFKKKRKTPVPLNSLETQTDLDPSSLISRILASKDPSVTRGRESFLNMSNHKLSMLVPYIKLYKVDGDKYVPFHFPKYTHTSEIQTIINSGGHLQGAGIRSFDAKFQGKDTFTSERIIDCNLSFYVQNMSSFFEVTQPGHAPLAELITIKKPPRSYDISTETIPAELRAQSSLKTKGLEIKVDFGWSFYPEMSHHFTNDERLAIEESRMSLRLTLTNHTFSFSQEGLVEVQAQYIGRLEAAFDNKSSDLFLSKRAGKDGAVEYFKDINEKLKEINERYKKQDKKPTSSEKERRAEEAQKLKTDGLVGAYSSILNQLDPDIKTSAIRSVIVSRTEEQNYFSEVNKEAAKVPADQSVAAQAAAREPQSPNEKGAPSAAGLVDLKSRTIHYVYLIDLVEAVLMILGENYKGIQDKDIQAQLSTFRIVLGVTKIRTSNDKDNENTIVPIGEIPISIRQYSEWFRDNIIRLSKHRFGFKSFIESMISDLMEASLRKMNFRNAPLFAKNVKFGTIVLTTNQKHAKLDGRTMIKTNDLPTFLHGVEVDRYDTDVDYILFYSYETGLQKQTTKKGDQSRDLRQGIFHFFLGKDRGLIKEISFSKVDIPFRKEALIDQSYSIFEELRMPYNATIRMFGNNLFRPGSQIYINPSTIGMGDPRNPNSSAVRLGLGGYYQVTNVRTSMAESGIETVLEAVFTGWPSNESIASYLPVGEGTASEGLLRRVAREAEVSYALEDPENATV